MAHLPQDLIVEILIRLLVKPLLRFKCLYKPSCAVIDSPDFIRSHLSKSSQNFNLAKLILSDLPKANFHVCDVNVNLKVEIPPVPSSVGAVSGNCNGLLLLNKHKIGFSVYNPSTHQCRDLPDFPFETKIRWGFESKTGWGLGYDESIDEYKAVVSVYNYKVMEPQVWVCGLKSNIWRRVENSPAPLFEFGYFANGHLHWVCEMKESESKFEVVAFDVSTEKFSLVPRPILFKFHPKLHVLEGCLCISYLYNRMPMRADIYIRMKKDGVDTFTWTQLHSAKKPFKNVDALEHSNGADKILLDLGHDRACIVSYDLKMKSFVKVEMYKNPGWTDPIICVESLVPAGAGA